MKQLKKIIKLFIQKIYLNYIDLRDLCVYYRNKSKKVNYSVINKKNSTALIFGNGPSLNDILYQTVKLENADIFVCNGFATTSNYEILKPENYVLLDPSYFDFNNKYVKEIMISPTHCDIHLDDDFFLHHTVLGENLLNLRYVNGHPTKIYRDDLLIREF